MTGGKGEFKPIECSSMKVQQHIGNFGAIVRESIRSVMEVQETLGQERLKFIGIETIALVRFPDLSLSRGFPGVFETISKSAKGLGKTR